MTFRRQDIPKTTRKVKEGSGRRLYPRFLRDRVIVPKVELAIDYLDRMTGRRRGDLSPETVLELFGDPKLARCLLGCMSETYRPRPRCFTDAIGNEATERLAQLGLKTPADLRGLLYLAANATRGGFVGDEQRASFLAERGDALGLSAGQIDELIHLDAERNAVLVRFGQRPSAEDIVARYNVLLLLSVLRHASSVALTLPGIDAGSVEAVLARHGIAAEWTGGESILLRGRASAAGTWSGFGGRVARCTLQLMALCPRMPEGEARVHFGDQTLAFEIDGKAAAFARPAQRAVSDGAGIVLAAGLEDEIAGRRKAGDGLDGWTLRRWPGPVVVEGALVLPELTLTRGDTHVAIVAASKRTALAAIERVNQSRPAILLAEGPVLTDVPVLVASEAPKRLVELLAEIAPQPAGVPSPLELVAAELARANWIRWSDLVDRFGESGDPRTAVAPLTDTGEAVFLPDSGLYAAGVVAWLRTLVNGGPIDVGSLRRAALEAVANGAAADALTLYVLGESTLRVEPDRAAA